MSELHKEIDSLFSNWDRDDSPGCILAIVKDREIVYSKGYGMANLEHRVPITADSVFRTGSVSKQFTAMCIALLVERRDISLDDSVRKYVPELPSYADKVTIRHMVHHISGIRSYTSLLSISMLSLDTKDADMITKDMSIEMVARQKTLEFKPGEKYEYSNSNYFLLGLIVERVSGKSLRRFAEDEIFKPLGMKNTHYHDDCKMVVPNRAYGYAPKEGDGFEVSMSNCEVVGDGCVFSSANDLLHWDSNFYDNKLPGGKRLIETMETSGILNSGDEYPYAFGLFKSFHKGLPLIDHGGAWAGFRAYMGRFPEQRFSIILLANISNLPVGKLGKQVADLYLEPYYDEVFRSSQPEETKPLKSVKVSQKELDEIAGLYLTPNGMLLEVSRVEDNLSIVVSGWNESRTTYIPVSKTRFHPDDGMFTSIIEVVRVSEKKPLRLMSHKPDGTTSNWEPIPKTLSKREVRDFAGIYYSRELDSTYILEKSESGTLVCRTVPSFSGNHDVHKLRKDEVVFLGIQLKFSRNKQGMVNGFDLFSSGGVNGVRFRKVKKS
ncbi:MAG: serine hydrolase domain-containing protein [Candidatus Thorarchaeota archaeon]